ncbi:MAG TPA: VIT domain-containing protein, partial [Kiloniellales bacterium]|nr:VIT domain-containing protein [Kiloniellales bacterium]
MASDVEIEVNGLVARVTVRQHFVNPTSIWLEGLYVFPLPERSAVDRLVMIVGERRIEGEIMEREAARKTYEKAKAEGKRAGLLASERANVFTTSVANIGPGDEVVIEIEYQDRVAYRDGVFLLRFPMVVAPRYTPGGPPLTVRAPNERGAPTPQPVVAPPGEGRDLFGPVRDPARGPINPVTLTVALDAGLPLAEVKSLYHPVVVETHDPRRRTIRLENFSVPADRDFVLEWTPEPSAAPEAAVFGEKIEGASYLSVLVVPPARTDDSTPRPPRDLILVVDTSGSMHGASIAQAKAAIGKALGRLAPDDRFNVIRFDSRTDSLFVDARPAEPGNLRAAARYVAAFNAEGGTEMMPALVQALAGRA